MWFVVLFLSQIILLLLFLYFVIPRSFLNDGPTGYNEIINLFYRFRKPIFIILFVVFVHLIEVRFFDPEITSWIGNDYANVILKMEGDVVFWFSQNWNPVLLHYFVFIYIIVYPFTLWFSPVFFIISNNKKAINTLSYGLLLIYLIAVPFYLFLPISNVYTYYGFTFALEMVIPNIENFFYSTTTSNNCLPSLHTAMTILVTYSVSLTNNKKLYFVNFFIMCSVIISVIYLSIHWISDVIIGALLSVGVITVIKKYELAD